MRAEGEEDEGAGIEAEACAVCQIVGSGEAETEEETTDTFSSPTRSNGLSSGKGDGLLPPRARRHRGTQSGLRGREGLHVRGRRRR